MTSVNPCAVGDLIERLEAATGPDRELDADIHAFIHGGYVEGATRPSNRAVIWHQDRGTEPAPISGFPNQTRKLLCYADAAPRYTESLDDARSLVLDGRKWSVGTWSGNFATVGIDHERPAIAEVNIENCSGGPIIALCIAALRARTATPTPEER